MEQMKQKIAIWQNKLLDLGKRNRMLYFKPTSTSFMRFIAPSGEEIIKKILSDISLEIEYQNEENTLTKASKKNKVLCTLPESDGKKLLYRLRSKGKLMYEEHGVHSLYLACGFLSWANEENLAMLSPLLLVPIKLISKSLLSPFTLALYEEEVIVNPTLKYKLKETFHLDLPEYRFDMDFHEYFQLVIRTLNLPDWKIENELYLGFFSFSKVNMYMDLKHNIDLVSDHEIIKALCNEQNKVDSVSTEAIDLDKAFQADTLYTVVDADSSQLEAIYHAIDGKSFVLQGPPGTGKSTTITNIIANSLAKDKKVLFVSEKMAALEVVYNNLKRVGLEDFCLPLHSHKANKIQVIQELTATLQKNKTIFNQDYLDHLDELENTKNKLNEYVSILHQPVKDIGKTAYEIFGVYAKYQHFKDVEYHYPNDTINKNDVLERTSLIQEYATYCPTIGKDYRLNPHYAIKIQDSSFENINRFEKALEKNIKNCTQITNSITRINSTFSLKVNNVMKEIKEFVPVISLLNEIEESKVEWFDIKQNKQLIIKLQELKTNSKEFIHLQNFVKSIEPELMQGDITNLYRTFQIKYSSIFRIFHKEYRHYMRLIKINTFNMNLKINYFNALLILKNIKRFQDLEMFFNDQQIYFSTNIGDDYQKELTPCDRLLQRLEQIQQLIPLLNHYGTKDTVSLIHQKPLWERKIIYKPFLMEYQNSFDDFSILSKVVDQHIVDFTSQDIKTILNKLELCKKNLPSLPDWISFYKVLKKLQEKQLDSFIIESINQGIKTEDYVSVFMKKVATTWVDYVMTHEPILKDFTIEKQEELVSHFCRLDQLQFKIAKIRIREHLSSHRPNSELISKNSEVGILLRESEKKRQQKPLRKLFYEIPSLLSDLKPCLLMSPMSISTYLSNQAQNFDLVIFDEASQIFPEDALGAIYRGKQVIIVGDSKQLPPTNFFHVTSIEEQSEDEEDLSSFESILDIASSSLNQIRLKWHYRSKNEELIAFSNRMIYQNRLITFPTPNQSTKDYGVEFIYVENGVYDRSGSRNNEMEAKKVAQVVFETIQKFPNRSLGVVAFSEAQADAVEKEVYQLRNSNPIYEEFFDETKDEPFFIKNIESVQGDERDTILFSMGYGKDKKGKMFMNFGPLSRDGGERRLNVAITRAKLNVKLIASILPSDIDDSQAKLGVKLLKSYMEYAGSENRFKNELNLNEESNSYLEDSVAELLEKNGYELDRKVGSSSYQVEIAVKHPTKKEHYLLGIEFDGIGYKECRTSRDRDRLRQEVMRNLGWEIIRIYSPSWVKRYESESKKLLLLLQTLVCNQDLSKNSFVATTPLTTVKSEPVMELFENKKQELLVFPYYQCVNWFQNTSKSPCEVIQRIVDEESPICEELLLKRVCGLFNREKVSEYVKKQFDLYWSMLLKEGYRKENNFYFSPTSKKITFRVPLNSDEERKIHQIYIEELVDGITKILEYHSGMKEQGVILEVCKYLGYQKQTEQIQQHVKNALLLAKSRNLIIQINDTYASNQG